MWGLIMPYVNSYLRLNHDFEPSLINLGSSALYLGDYLGCRKVYIELCYLIYKKIGLNKELAFAILVTCLGYGIVALNSNPYMVIIVDNLIVGFGCGLLTISSLWPLWSHFGNTNATLTGVVVMAYSLGATIYANIFTQVVNPDNLTPKGDKSTDQIYPQSVADRVPMGFLVFAIVTSVIGFGAMIMIKSKPKTDSETEHDTGHNKSYKEILLSYNFWRLFVLFYLDYYAVAFLISDYRVFMLKHISDDHLISYASSIITIANNIGRVMWMIFLDYTNFKTLVVVINLAVATLLFTIPMIWSNTTLLITWMSGIWLFGSGLYPSFIVETYRIFPGDSGKKAYPILTLPWTLAIFSMNGVTAIGDWYGYTYVMYILILCSLGSIILVLIFPAKIEKSVKEVDLIDELILEDKDVSINP
jgi:hypothetical protein